MVMTSLKAYNINLWKGGHFEHNLEKQLA